MSADLEQWHNTLEKGIRGVLSSIDRVVVREGGRSYPEDESIGKLVEWMKGLGASELLIEAEGEKMLVVKQEYGSLCAAVQYRNGIPPADLSRLIQLLFAGRVMRVRDGTRLPAGEAERLIKRWKRTIALVFGAGFAGNLVEGALRDRDRNTPDGLEAARAIISSALADCLVLDKVNK